MSEYPLSGCRIQQIRGRTGKKAVLVLMLLAGVANAATTPPDWAMTPDTPPADLPRTPIARDSYFGICGCPAWATADGSPFSPPRELKHWESFMETLARRYRGRVSVWEIWNEPDLKGYWTGTSEQYAALLKSAYQAAKRGNLDCLIMSGGLDGPGERYLRNLAEMFTRLLANDTAAALKLQAHVHKPQEWIRAEVDPALAEPASQARVRLEFHPPALTPGGEIPCVLAAFTSGGGPAVAQAFTLDVVNRGEACGLALESGIAAMAGADGQAVRPRLTPDRIVAVPGKRMLIVVMLANHASQPETYHLELSGPAAPWVQDFPTSAAARGGARTKENLLITVPPDTPVGTYPLILSAICTRHPAATARLEFGIWVGAPQSGVLP